MHRYLIAIGQYHASDASHTWNRTGNTIPIMSVRLSDSCGEVSQPRHVLRAVVVMSYGVKEDVRCASIVKTNCTWRVYLRVPMWRQDTRWGGYDILRSNTGRTFYQRLDVRASVVDVRRSIVQFLCFVGGCSTAPGWWDVNRQSLDLLTMTRIVYSMLPVQDPYSVVAESSVTSRWLVFVIHYIYACSRDAETLAAEDVPVVESLLMLGFCTSCCRFIV